MKSHTHDAEQYKIGFADIDITPPLSLQIRLGGYLRFHKIASGVLHPLYAHAFCIRNSIQEESGLLIISCDLLGMQYRHTSLLRKIISRKTNIPISNIIIHFTHSHSTPDTTGVFPNQLRGIFNLSAQTTVIKYLIKKIIQSGVQAWADAQREFEIGFGFTDTIVPPISGQRRPPHKLISDPIRFIKICSSSKENSTENTHPRRSNVLALLINYQGHPTQLPQQNTSFSPEYPGFICSEIRKMVPDIKFVAYFNGASGDVSIRGYKGYGFFLAKAFNRWKKGKKNPKFRIWMQKVAKKTPNLLDEALSYADEQIRTLGERFSSEIIKHLETTQTHPLISCSVSRKFMLPKIGGRYPIQSQYSLIPGKSWRISLRYKYFMNSVRVFLLSDLTKLLSRDHKSILNQIKNGRDYYHPTEMQLIHLNDIKWLAAPGEPFYIYQQDFLKLIPNGTGFFSSLSNDTCGYIFPWNFFLSGGYELTFSFDLLFGKLLRRTYMELLKKDSGHH